MWYICTDCEFEIDPEEYSADDRAQYGCPICGSHCLDEEVVTLEKEKPKELLLFELPPKEAKERTPFKKTQRWICKRCSGSVHDKAGAYCERFDLCLEFDQGRVLLAKNGSPIKCDGKEWEC